MENSSSKEVTAEHPGFVRIYNDGSIDRLREPSYVPPSPEDPTTGVSSKDIIISANTNLQARLYLPKVTDQTQKLPTLVYFHGGGFCIESAFSIFHHRYINLLCSCSQSLILSVEYRLVPEHPLPAAYEDGWTALNWVASHKDSEEPTTEPWLTKYGDFGAVFIGGDSAGGNIVHNIAMRAKEETLENEVKILGAFMSHSYFLIKDDNNEITKVWEFCRKIWQLAYPKAPGGLDCPMINPLAEGAPSLRNLGCERVFVLVAGDDEFEFRDVAVKYYEAIRESGFEGQVELFESEGEGHVFHLINPDTEKAKLMIQRLAYFLRK